MLYDESRSDFVNTGIGRIVVTCGVTRAIFCFDGFHYIWTISFYDEFRSEFVDTGIGRIVVTCGVTRASCCCDGFHYIFKLVFEFVTGLLIVGCS